MMKLFQLSNSASLKNVDVDQQKIFGARTGYLKSIDNEGQLFVDFPGNPHGPIIAKIALDDIEIADLIESVEETEVLLVFDDNDLCRPIIVGRVRDRVPKDGVEIRIHGRRFMVECDEEIELHCSQAKFRINRDGKIIVLGENVVSRARGRNRIKGGTVTIN
jgi:hypothetical protein